MCGVILKATKSSFQRGMTFCISIYMKKVMNLLAFIFEQPSLLLSNMPLHFFKNSFIDFSIEERLLRAVTM